MKNIVIIGASSGIGKALLLQVAKTDRVFGTYRNTPVSISDDRISMHYLDVLEENPDFGFLPEVIDGLVYCVGAISLKPFARIKPEDFMADYQRQVLGAIKAIQACLPGLKKAETTGSIVLVSTVAVKMGFPFHTLVSSSKGAIEGLTKALAAELSPKIRVNAIAPSITQTPMAEHLLNTPDKIEANAQRHPLKRIGAPEDMAQGITFLLSEASAWITGQVLAIDGGISAVKTA